MVATARAATRAVVIGRFMMYPFVGVGRLCPTGRCTKQLAVRSGDRRRIFRGRPNAGYRGSDYSMGEPLATTPPSGGRDHAVRH